MKEKTKMIILDTICVLFIFLFIYAAVSKWIDFQRFKVQIGQSPILTDFSKWIPWFVPMLEMGISFLLFLPAGRRIGLYAAFSLMAIFSGYIILIKWFSPFTPCSCGGILQNMNWNQHLVFNLIFIGIAVTGVILESRLSFKSKYLLQ